MTQTVPCPTCGEANLPSSNFCHNCGAVIPPGPVAVETVSTKAQDHDTPAAVAAAAGEKVSTGATVVLRGPDGEPMARARPAEVNLHVVGFQTDIGHSHHVNQDAGGAWTWTRPDGVPASLLIVADGVSAGRHSEEASRLTVDIVYDRLAELLAETSKEMDTLAVALAEATKHANHEVAKRPHHSLSSADATTIVAAICIGGEGCGVWCGDSRVYRLTPHGAIQLTHDHSWAEQVVRAGLLSPEEASRDPRAHMITRWLGPPPQDDPGIEIFRFTIQPGDAVMCCTDGLYGYFSPPLADEEADMARMLSGSVEDLNNRIQQLVDIALERGGRDNISLAVLAAGTKSESRRPTAGKSPTPRTVDQTLVLKSGEQAT